MNRIEQLIGGGVLVAALAAANAASQTPRTVRDGVYSEEQAKRGKSVYDEKCGSCHDGTGMGPELKDEGYFAAWESKNVRAFYSRILSTMPDNDPGSLKEGEVLDIVAYLLQAHGFPPGAKALESASELDGVSFVSGK